jgi:lysophospholipase L1-like esterase
MSFDATRAIYGQGNASQYLKDAKNGVDSLDIVVIGDSNAGFGAYGWHEGLAKALVETEGISLYATTLAPFVGFTGSGNAGSIGYRTGWDWAPVRASTEGTNPGVAYSVSQTSLTTYGGLYDGFLRGNTDANCAKLRESFNIGVCSGDNQDGSDFLSNNMFWGFGFSESTGSTNPVYYSHVHGGFGLDSNHPFVGQAFSYRVIHSRGLGGGTMTMNIRAGSTDLATAKAVATDDGSTWKWSVSELDKTSTGDSAAIRCSCFGLSTAARAVSGNVGFLFHSVYRKIKGIAVNNLMYMGGRTSGQLASILTNTSDKALTTYISELINRQRAAGGTGRILFFILCGTNDSGQNPQPTSQAFLENIRTIINRLALAYNRTGDSTNSPAFMAMVSHPMTATDADDSVATNSLTPYREVVALNSGNKYNQLPCDFVNLLGLKGTYATTYNRLFDQSLYAASNTDLNHLSSAGFDELSAPLAQAIIAYTPPASTRKIDVSDGRLGVWHRIDVLSTAVVKDRSWLLANADSEANAIGMLNQCWTNLGKAGSPPNRTYFTREDAGLNDAATLPGAPSAPTSSSVTSTEITVNINVASATFGGSLPTAVRVRAIPTIAGTPTLTLDTAISYPWPTTAKTVNTLTANTSYNVSYALINAAGTGTYSTATAISTAP